MSTISNFEYTVARTIFGTQQVVGAFSILKHSAGMVNDICTAISSFRSFTTINSEISEIQKTIGRAIGSFESLREFNKRSKDAIEKTYIHEFNFELGPAMQILVRQELQWELPPLSQEDLKKIPRKEVMTDLDLYIKRWQIVDLQIQNEVNCLKSGYDYLELKRCTPLCDRVESIADAILTATPVLGTLYNGYLLIPHLDSEV